MDRDTFNAALDWWVIMDGDKGRMDVNEKYVKESNVTIGVMVGAGFTKLCT